MPNNWKTYKLGEIATLGDGAHSKVKRLEEGVLYLTSKNFKEGRLHLAKVDYISLGDYTKLFNSSSKAVNKPTYGDLLMGIIGTLGNVYCYKQNDNFGISSSVAIIRPNQEKISSKYLYYYITGKEFKHYQNAHNGASVQGYTNLPSLRSIPIKVPPLQEQRAIANILTAIDDKIELNLQQNRTLEEMAMALYKHWFVDFEFSSVALAKDGIPQPYKSSGGEFVESELGKIPKGWEVKRLGEELEIKYGKDHKKLEAGDIPVYGSGGVMRYVNQYLYDEDSILIPRKGTLSNLFYLRSPFWSVDTMFYTKIKNSVLGKYIFYYLKTLDLASMDVGSAVPSLTTDLLKKLKIITPKHEDVAEYDKMVTRNFDRVEHNIKENQTLTKLRDTLLPKLISGEVRVKDIEETVKSAL